MNTRCYTLAALCLLVAVPDAASAHNLDAQHDIVAGLLHPLTGVDHLLTLLAAGFWAQRLGGAARASIPIALLLALWGGATLAMLGVQWSSVEPLVCGSMLTMAWLAMRGVALSAPAGCTLAVTVGTLHGYVHAAGLPVDSGIGWFIAGLLVMSAALLGAGAAFAASVIPRTQPVGSHRV